MSEGGEETRNLDLLSSDFDALRALTVRRGRVSLPDPNAPIYDNMTWFVETENGIFPRERTAKKTIPAASTSGMATTSKTRARTAGRITWKNSNAALQSGDPLSQEPERPQGSVAKRRVHKNVLTNMDTVVGPLAFLKKCMDEKLRVKVFIRSAASIRGFCIGYVEAFDKHMNMVLKDVYETWKRPRKKHRKTISIEAAKTDSEKREKADDDEEEEESDTPLPSISDSTFLHKYAPNDGGPKKEDRNACYRIARWVVKRRTKKKDICERHVHQLLIRGEQVVCVMLER